MHQIFPKVNQVFAYHLKNFEVINSLMDSVNLRVDAEEQYERAINKSANKISELQSQHPLYSKIILSFKSLINQRAHQIRHFKKQIAKQAQTLKNALSPIEQFMKSHLSELKSMQKELKLSFDTLTKSKTAAQQKMKELDQKFVLNQITILYKQNIGLRKNSQSYISQQENILKGLEKDWQSLRVGVMNFETGALERQKRIWELDVKVEEEFVDFFKKLNVHQISLIRNIQYDIDTMIKKTDIFNWQNTTEFINQFSIKTIDQLQQSFLDPYLRFKKAIIAQDQIMDPKSQTQCDADKLDTLKKKLGDNEECEEMLGIIRKSYAQYRDQICEWIQLFRKSGHFKFQAEGFQLLVSVFREVLKCAIGSLDFQCVQKTILYGNSYYTTVNNRKRTVLDQIKNEKLLCDLSFWRFYLLWTIRQAISNCKNKEQKDMHLRNGVYTTLLSNSLAMVQWGLQKHSIKNLIGKLAKTYASLTEVQVAELLKVIQTAYQNIEKAKKGKKE